MEPPDAANPPPRPESLHNSTPNKGVAEGCLAHESRRLLFQTPNSYDNLSYGKSRLKLLSTINTLEFRREGNQYSQKALIAIYTVFTVGRIVPQPSSPIQPCFF